MLLRKSQPAGFGGVWSGFKSARASVVLGKGHQNVADGPEATTNCSGPLKMPPTVRIDGGLSVWILGTQGCVLVGWSASEIRTAPPRQSSQPNRGRSARISEDERKPLSLLNVGHQDRPKTRDACSTRATDARVDNSRGAGLQKLGSERLRSNIADWRQAISVFLRTSNVMEFGAKIRPIVDVIRYFFFVPIRFLQPELLMVSNFRLGSLHFRARIPRTPIRRIEPGAVRCRVAEGRIDDPVRRNSKDQFSGIDPW